MPLTKIKSPPMLDMNRADLRGILAMPNPGLYPVDTAPVGFTKPVTPGGPPQVAADYARQSEPVFDRRDCSLEGPWRTFFARAVRPGVQHL